MPSFLVLARLVTVLHLSSCRFSNESLLGTIGAVRPPQTSGPHARHPGCARNLVFDNFLNLDSFDGPGNTDKST